MAFFDFFKTKVAAPSKHSHVYQPNHICTHDFGIVLPVLRKYMVPGDEFSISLTQFTRLMPLPCPTFGVVKTINRAYFVPLDFVMTNFHEYLQGNYSKSLDSRYPTSLKTPAIPYVTVGEILKFLISYSTECLSTDKWDIKIVDDIGPGTYHYYQFDWRARKTYQFLVSLGMNIPLTCNTDDNYEFKVSVLPLLAFWKFYVDYVVPVRYRHAWREFDSLFTDYTTDNCHLSNNAQLSLILRIPTAWLSPDYFNSAFENPFGTDYNRPAADIISNPSTYSLSGTDYLMNGSTSKEFNNQSGNDVGARIDTTGSSGSGNSNALINAFTIQSLGVLQDMVNRNRITDVKVREWLYVTYGIAPNNDSLHLSTYLGSSDNDIMIGDIMATAKTEVDNKVTHVGEYSGKGLGGQSANWKYSADHHGYIFVTNEICARTSYTQGLDPDFRYFDKRQFFDPMLDNLGCTAIERSELAIDIHGLDDVSLDAAGVYGFKPNYAEMKRMSDIVSGDFRVPSINEGLDSWYLSRLIDSSNWSGLKFVNEHMSRALEDGVYNNYDRIFQYTGIDADHFYSVFRFDIKAQRPMLSLTEILEPKEAAHGRDVTVDKQQ